MGMARPELMPSQVYHAEEGGGFGAAGLSLLGQHPPNFDRQRQEEEQRIISEIVNNVTTQNVHEAYSIPVRKFSTAQSNSMQM